MKNKNKAKSSVQSKANISEATELKLETFSWRKFVLKCLLLGAFIIGFVSFTDMKGYFVAEQKNNHIRNKWASFYEFTKKKEVDVLILGNSHVITGVDPFVLSTATGTNCFILGNSGTNIMDAWFQLGEALKHTTPKLIVLETYCINEQSKPSTDIITPYLQSFDAQKNRLYKLKRMPELFHSDNWVAAWSTSIRNHSFLLNDKERIKQNIKKPDKYKPTKLDLGRFARFNTGLQDTTLQKYEKLGAPVNGNEYMISDHSKKYLKKVMDMCAEKNIPIVFLTVPMYYKHVSNYGNWKNTLNEELKQYANTKWLDLQLNYDASLYTPDKFENTYSANQHLSNQGMAITAFKLAEFIEKEYPNLLPDRTQEAVWIKDFSSNDYYAFLNDVNQNMPGYNSILRNKQVGNFFIKELAVKQNKDTDRIILKLKPSSQIPNNLNAQVVLNAQGNNLLAKLVFVRPTDIYSPNTTAYITDINKGFTLLDIVSLEP